MNAHQSSAKFQVTRGLDGIWVVTMNAEFIRQLVECLLKMQNLAPALYAFARRLDERVGRTSNHNSQ